MHEAEKILYKIGEEDGNFKIRKMMTIGLWWRKIQENLIKGRTQGERAGRWLVLCGKEKALEQFYS